MKNMPESSFQVTIFTKDNGVLTKTIKREGNGKLIKDNTKCLMASGTAETIPLENMNNFAEVLQELEHNQALSYGISGQDILRDIRAGACRQKSKGRQQEKAGSASRGDC